MEVIGKQVCLLRFTGLWRHGIWRFVPHMFFVRAYNRLLSFPHSITFSLRVFFLVGKYHSVEFISFQKCMFCPSVTYFLHFLSEVRTVCFSIDYLITEPQFTLSFGYSLCHSGCMFVHTFRCNWSLHLSQLVCPYIQMQWSLHLSQLCLSIHSDATDLYISASYGCPYIQMQLISTFQQLWLSIHSDATDLYISASYVLSIHSDATDLYTSAGSRRESFSVHWNLRSFRNLSSSNFCSSAL